MRAALRRALGGPGSLSILGGAESREAWPAALGRAVRGAAAGASGSRGGEGQRCSRRPQSPGRPEQPQVRLPEPGGTLVQNFVEFEPYRLRHRVPRLPSSALAYLESRTCSFV